MRDDEQAFSDYEIYNPPFGYVRNTLTKTKAGKAFEHDMAVKGDRLEMFGKFMKNFGIATGFDDGDIDRIYRWLGSVVTLDPDIDPMVAAASPLDPIFEPVVMDPRSESLAWDFGLFIGEAIIHRHPTLEWEIGAGSRKTINFQRPAVGHYLHENGFQKQWEVMWKARSATVDLAVGDYDPSLLRFINYWPERSE